MRSGGRVSGQTRPQRSKGGAERQRAAQRSAAAERSEAAEAHKKIKKLDEQGKI
jgi:hypothetical protein